MTLRFKVLFIYLNFIFILIHESRKSMVYVKLHRNYVKKNVTFQLNTKYHNFIASFHSQFHNIISFTISSTYFGIETRLRSEAIRQERGALALLSHRIRFPF